MTHPRQRKAKYWSRTSPEGPWDYVVIGSGMGGMTSAALLSKLGKRVLVSGSAFPTPRHSSAPTWSRPSPTRKRRSTSTCSPCARSRALLHLGVVAAEPVAALRFLGKV